MKKTSKLMCILLTAVMLLSSLPIVSSASDKTGTANASCGAWADVNYTYDSSSGILTLDFVLNNPNCLGESYFCLYVDESIYTDGKIVSGSRKSADGLWTSSVQYAAGQPDFIFEMYDGPYYCFRVRRSDSYDYFADPYSGQVELGTLSFRFLPKDNYNYQDIPYRFLTYCSFSYLGDEPGADDYSYFTIDLNNENTVENDSWTLENGVLTVSGNGAMTDFENTQLTPWYKNRDSITGIVIKNGVTHIGKNSFADLRNVKDISIAGSVQTIGVNAFSGLNNVTSLTLPEGLVEIGDHAFCYMDKIPSVTIPSTVKKVGSCAFERWDSLESFTFGSGTEYIGSWCVSGSKLQEINIPASVTHIDNQPFGSGSEINVATGNKVYKSVDGILYSIQDKTLLYCPVGKEGRAVIADGTERIAPQAFMYTMLNRLVIPDSVIYFEDDFLVPNLNNCILICSEGSAAHKYAEEHNLAYSFTDDDPVVIIPGDVNGDGRLTTNDAKATLRHVAGLIVLVGDNLANADFNGDGKVTTNDAKKMLRVIAGLE